MGMIIALDTRYEVMVHVDSSMPAERLPLIWSKETFTTEVSIISISVGSITVRAIIHLLHLFMKVLYKSFRSFRYFFFDLGAYAVEHVQLPLRKSRPSDKVFEI